MAQKYGNTWWSQQWLNAFNGIDHSNRLPRGRTYANKGSVHDIQVKENLFSAKVHGSRRTPYRIRIEQPVFSKKEEQTILAIIERSPSMLSRLMSRQLPESLWRH